MRKVDPRHLPAVLAVVEHGSFARAAQALGVSQPALSKSIAQLERRLGVRLFERGAKGATLTEAGEVVARGARNLDAILATAEAEIGFLMEGSDAPLTIGVSPSLMLRLVPDALARLSDEGLTTSLKIIEGLDDPLMAALRRGELDLVVGPIRELHGEALDIVETPLARDTYFVGMRPDHRLARRASLKLSDLRDEAWILPMPGSTQHRVVESLFVAAGLPWPKGLMTTNSLQAMERLILATDRLSIVTGSFFLGGERAMKPVPLEGAPSRTIGIKQRRDCLLPPYGARFIEALKQAAAGLEGAEPPLTKDRS